MSDRVFKLIGATNHLAESSPNRAKNDFYSTPRIATEELLKMLKKHNIVLSKTIIEPGVGNGGIANVLLDNDYKVIGYDIIDRGFPETILKDFREIERPNIPISIIANFPFSDILEMTYKSLSLLNNGEYLISFARIQFLEGIKRRELFDRFPPRFVFVFSKRIRCFNEDKHTDEASAICFAWFVWEKGYTGLPTIDWI